MESAFWDKNVGKILQVAVWLLAFYVAWYVIPKGYEKLTDVPGTVDFFATLGIPTFMVYVSAFIEIVGSLLMFVPRLAFYGAFPLAINMFVASYSTEWGLFPLRFGVVALIIAIMTRPGFLFRKKPTITRVTV